MPTVSGIWVFNETITEIASKPSSNREQIVASLTFGIGETKYSYLGVMLDNFKFALFYKNSSSTTVAYIYEVLGGYWKEGWQKESYRTIDFGTSVYLSDNLYAWLTANATRLPVEKFDMSRLSLTGTHNITVKAKATGYLSSPSSEAVEYTVG